MLTDSIQQGQVSLTPSLYEISYNVDLNQYVFEDINTKFMSFIDHIMIHSVLSPYLDSRSISELVNNVHSFKPSLVDLVNRKVMVKKTRNVSSSQVIGLMMSPGFIDYTNSLSDEVDMTYSEQVWSYYDEVRDLSSS